MNEDKENIFEYIDLFGGYKGAFSDNWLNGKVENEDSANSAKISTFQIDKVNNYSSPLLPVSNSDSSRQVDVNLMARIQTTGRVQLVYVNIGDSETKYIATRTSGSSIYEAPIKVSIPKSFARIDQYGSQEFLFKANIIDANSLKISDSKIIKLQIDTTGNVSELAQDNSKIKIVLDPGHGYATGSTGTASRIYTFKVKGDNGEAELDEEGTFITKDSNIINLPQYVIDYPTLWVVSTKEDLNNNERNLVFDISTKLLTLLSAKGFTCYNTRQSRLMPGSDDSTSRNNRIKLANNNSADYFISIHADGIDNMTATGAHAIYPKTTDQKIKNSSRTLGIDILRFYNVVQVIESSPVEDVRELQVLGVSNKCSRKVLVELCYMTTPRDAKALFTNVDRIALQLFQGLNYSIANNFSR